MSIILNESLDFRTEFRWSGAWRQTKSTAPHAAWRRGGAAAVGSAVSGFLRAAHQMCPAVGKRSDLPDTGEPIGANLAKACEPAIAKKPGQ